MREDERANDVERGKEYGSPLALHFSSGKNKPIQPQKGWISAFSWPGSICLTPAASPIPVAGGGKQEVLLFLPGWSQKMIRADQEAKARCASGSFEGVLGANYQAA